MKASIPFLTTTCLLGAFTPFPLMASISLSSLDSFASTAEGWVEGVVSPNPPTHNSGNGRDGSAGFLVNLSNGSSGAGGRQLMWTEAADWTGDYLSALVTALEFWVDNNTGTGSSVNLRIAFDGPGGWFVSTGQTVSDTVAGSEWTRLEYSISSPAFTWISSGGGTGNFNDTFSAVTRFEVLVSDSLPGYGAAGDILMGDVLVSELHFDDFRAIPEPGSLALVVAGLAVMAGNRRRIC